MKAILLLFGAFFSLNFAFAQILWVGVRGQTQFCPDDNRQLKYDLKSNFDVGRYRVMCNRCYLLSPIDGVQWIDGGMQGYYLGIPPDSITVRWYEGNYDDAWIEYSADIGLLGYRKDKQYVKLVENVGNPIVTPNVEPTISSSVSSIACGSTSSITFTANWKNANSYIWEVTGGSKSGCTTCASLTVIPYGSSNVVAKVKGHNNACNVDSPQVPKSVTVNPPNVNAISGPDYVCYGAPSVVSHYVNNIPGVDYTWTSGDPSYLTPTSGSTSIYVNALRSGSFDLTLTAIGCGAQPIVKTKTVIATNSTPVPPYISQYPGTHCAGSCATYYTQIPTGYAVERQFRYNYGYWDVANSNGSIYICTQSYDTGYKPVELRSKGICGTFSSIYTQSINISYCGYMMATNEEDSLALTELKVENEISLYPNPSTTTMTISLPEEMEESQIIILSDQGEVITTFENTKTMFTLNTSKLEKGKYYLSVAGKEKKLTKRFVVE